MRTRTENISKPSTICEFCAHICEVEMHLSFIVIYGSEGNREGKGSLNRKEISCSKTRALRGEDFLENLRNLIFFR